LSRSVPAATIETRASHDVTTVPLPDTTYDSGSGIANVGARCVLVLGERNGQAIGQRRSPRGAGEEAFGPLKQVSREGEEVVDTTGLILD
jgi:hypothetical protein